MHFLFILLAINFKAFIALFAAITVVTGQGHQHGARLPRPSWGYQDRMGGIPSTPMNLPYPGPMGWGALPLGGGHPGGGGGYADDREGSRQRGRTILMEPVPSTEVKTIPNPLAGWDQPVTYTFPGATFQLQPVTYDSPLITFEVPKITSAEESLTYAVDSANGYDSATSGDDSNSDSDYLEIELLRVK